jgi:hypothetical protein
MRLFLLRNLFGRLIGSHFAVNSQCRNLQPAIYFRMSFENVKGDKRLILKHFNGIFPLYFIFLASVIISQ